MSTRQIVKMFFLMLVLIGSICLISCGDSGGNDPDPDPYVSFKNVNGSLSDEWMQGMAEFGNVPVASYRGNLETLCIVFETQVSNIDTSSKKNNHNHIFILLNVSGKNTGTYTGSATRVDMKMTGVNSGNNFSLSNQSVTIKKYTDSYIEGEYSGRDLGNNLVTGSFVFKNLGDNNWAW